MSRRSVFAVSSAHMYSFMCLDRFGVSLVYMLYLPALIVVSVDAVCPDLEFCACWVLLYNLGGRSSISSIFAICPPCYFFFFYVEVYSRMVSSMNPYCSWVMNLCCSSSSAVVWWSSNFYAYFHSISIVTNFNKYMYLS